METYKNSAFIPGSIEAGKNMHKPAQKKKPENYIYYKIEKCSKRPALYKLAKSRYEKAAKCCNHVSGGALICHR